MPLEGGSASGTPGKPAAATNKLNKRPATRLSSLVEDAAAIREESVDAPFRIRLHALFAQIEKEFEMLYLENLSLHEKLEAGSVDNREGLISSILHSGASASGAVLQHIGPSASGTSHAPSAIYTNQPAVGSSIVAEPNNASQQPPQPTATAYHRYVAPEYFDGELAAVSGKQLKSKLSLVGGGGVGNSVLAGGSLSSSGAVAVVPTAAVAGTGGSGSSAVKSDKIKASHKLRAQTSRIVSSFKGQSLVSSTVVREFDGHKDGVWSVSVKAGQPIIGTASADHTAAIWAIDSGRCLLQYHGHGGSVNTIKFHGAKDVVLTASGDGTAHIWQAAVKWEREQANYQHHHHHQHLLHTHPHNRVKGASSEEELDDMDDVDCCMDDSERGDRVDVLRTPLAEFGAGPGGHSSVVIAADWLPGGDQIITASWDRTAILWDVETKEPLQPLAGHDDELTYAAAHPSQRLVVTSSRDSTFRLWDFRDQIPAVSVFQGHSESVTSTVFTRDDKVVSGSDDRTVKVWELRNMRSALATIRTDASINKLAVSQSGVIAIPHDNRHIRLFDLHGQRVARLPRSNRTGHQRMASSVAWAEDPTYTCNLFSAGFDRRVLGWAVCLPKEN